MRRERDCEVFHEEARDDRAIYLIILRVERFGIFRGMSAVCAFIPRAQNSLRRCDRPYPCTWHVADRDRPAW